jgi:Bacterial Ig-like domain (group 2)/Electron transfer DM13
MKKLQHLFFFSTLILFSQCVGTDLIDDPIIGEKLTITPRIDSLQVGKEQVFTVKFSNKYGIEEAAKNVTWRSSEPTKISIDATGKAKALALGKATIYASNGTLTDSIILNKSSNNTTNNDTTFLKRGVFKPVSGSYNAAGNVRVQTVKGVTQIITDANFSTSAGPSLYLLLTNHTDGRYTVTPGSHAINAVSAQITPNKMTNFSGAQTWSVPSGVNPADYKFVVLYCVLGPVFGTAELK